MFKYRTKDNIATCIEGVYSISKAGLLSASPIAELEKYVNNGILTREVVVVVEENRVKKEFKPEQRKRR